MIRIVAFSVLFLLASSTSSLSHEQPQEHNDYWDSSMRAYNHGRLLEDDSDDRSPTPRPQPETKKCKDGKGKFRAGSYGNRKDMTCKELRNSSPSDQDWICSVSNAWDECKETCGRCDTSKVSETAKADNGTLLADVSITLLAQEQLPIFINCGGKKYQDSKGNTWIADAYYNTGDTFSELYWIFGTSDRALYRSNRYDYTTSKPDLTYEIPVLNGNYDVFLHFAELYGEAQTSGVRVFDVVVEGSVQFPDFDIYAEAGGYTALVKQTTTTVKDGFLTIEFVRKSENPEISGIEIRPSSVPFITSSGSSPAPSFAQSIKPSINPSSTPLLKPSLSPSANPSSEGSVAHTEIPSLSPSKIPSSVPILAGVSVSSSPSETQNVNAPKLQSSSEGPSASPLSQSVSPSEQPSATQQLSAAGGNRKVFGTVKAENDTLTDGISITLFDFNENVVATTMSGPEGKYEFNDVAPGEYFVESTYKTDVPYTISVNVDFSAAAPQPASTTGSEMPSVPPTWRTSIGVSTEPSTGPSEQPPEHPLEPSMAKSDLPSFGPSQAPTQEPSETSQEPSKAPSSSPPIEVSMEPSTVPSADSPLKASPTEPPMASPTKTPIALLTAPPTDAPTGLPTGSPTASPTDSATGPPNVFTTASSNVPSSSPSIEVAMEPSTVPLTDSPLKVSPTAPPTASPTKTPTALPTAPPTFAPTGFPTGSATASPTDSTTGSSKVFPSASPSGAPTAAPTAAPTTLPTISPTVSPTAQPTESPTASRTAFPMGSPTGSPTVSPIPLPTSTPTALPIASPTSTPTASPTVVPTDSPTAFPTGALATSAASAPFTSIYINAGGDAFTDSTNITWAADTYYVNGGTFQASQYEAISGTEDDILYRSERYDDSSDALKYEIPVPNGDYTTILHFAEIFAKAMHVGARVFDVSLEGSVVLSSLDIFAEVGKDAAMRTRAATQVTDGSLTIELIRHADNPKISAIEVHLTSEAPDPPPATPAMDFTPIYINAGGPALIDSKGTKWAKDEFFNTGGTYRTKEVIIGSTDQALYGTERYQKSDALDLLKYEIPVPDGNYLTTLHFADIFKQTHEIGGRVFDVLIEGFGVLRDLDIYAEAGPFAPLTKSIPTAVSDGALTIEFHPVMENPKISAIAVEPLESVAAHHAHAVPGGPYFNTDTDGDNVASITVDGTFSHSHGLGARIVDWHWIANDTEVGAGEVATFELPVGVHNLTLEVVDNFGDIASETTTVTIRAFGYPDITSLTPDSGFFEGGEKVLIAGSGFTAVVTDTIVHFGSVSLSGSSEIKIVSENTIEVKKAPPSSSGPVQVWVETPLGESNVVPYRYIDEMPIAFSTGKIMSGISGPSCVAFGNDGKLYVGTSKGLIFKLTLDDSNAVIDTTVSNVVGKSDTTLRSILGIAFDPMDTSPNPSLYVTHSTLFHKQLVSYNGKVSRVSGEKLDAIEHVVTGLPVSDLDHAVNGLVFGDSGELYIQVGGNTNAGVPGALSSSGLMEDALFSSATLVAHLSRSGYDGNVEYDDTGDQVSGFDVEIFASGQRNSFDITLHSNGHLYATDNGPNFKFGARSVDCSGTSEKDPSEGDELNLIVKGGFYGQANRKRGETDPRQCRWRSASEPSDVDYKAPLTVLPSSANGIVEFQTDHFAGKLRGHLIVGRYKGGLYDITLTSDGESVARGATLLIEQGGVGVTQGPDGTLFVACHDEGDVLLHAPNEPSSLDLEVKSTFPRRGPQTGGSLLSVYGKNLDSAGVTITVGGQNCPISGPTSESKLTCTLPSGFGNVDIVVATDTQADTLVGGYRYISGSE